MGAIDASVSDCFQGLNPNMFHIWRKGGLLSPLILLVFLPFGLGSGNCEPSIGYAFGGVRHGLFQLVAFRGRCKEAVMHR